MKPYIYLRVLRHAEHTVFCVQDGQKTYYDQQFRRFMPYSSGQQVKRSVLDALTTCLNVPMAPITFNYEINKAGKMTNKEPWSPCDPQYADQLIGGWMRAASTEYTIKRRSPLSISAMRPLHPLLAGTESENLTFDRSDRPENNPVNVRIEGQKEAMTEEQIDKWLQDNCRTLPRRHWIPENTRASGLFVFDIAIDLRTLFSVSLNQHDPELTPEMIDQLKAAGWIESQNTFGRCLVLPKAKRDEIIPALAHALLNWRITSNQARTFSLMETLAVAISDNANTLAGAIRAKLINEEGDREKAKAKPIVDETAGADLFVTLPAAGYMVTTMESADALAAAEQKLAAMMSAFDYEHQK